MSALAGQDVEAISIACSFFGHVEVVQWLCYRKDVDLTIKGPLDNRNRVSVGC